MIKKMDHVKYPKSLRSKTESELRFIIQDCKEVIECQPRNPNVSYYLDEICYCDAELARRQRNAG